MSATKAAVRPLLQSVCAPVSRQHTLLKPKRLSPFRRQFGTSSRTFQQAAASLDSNPLESKSDSTNPALSFPCLDALETKTQVLSSRSSSSSGPEPSYTTGAHQTFHSSEPLLLDWGGILPSFDIAYEAWGTLNSERTNAVLLHTGLSASSHAHSTVENSKPGWWEKFIGPGKALDTDRLFVICTNVIGGCFGSTGPSSVDPGSKSGDRYATRFPILTMEDMVRAQFKLLDGLGIKKLYASVGASMGGMQSLAAGCLFGSERVGRCVSISGCARSHPYSVAMRHTQRQVLMMDPNWNRGYYYKTGIPPHAGMKLAREIATVTYRSGPEWEQRFGRRRADPTKPPALCPDFLIETYLDHAGEKFCLEYDPNSLLYVSKAMDLFDLGAKHRQMITEIRRKNLPKLEAFVRRNNTTLEHTKELDSCTLTLPNKPYEEQDTSPSSTESLSKPVTSVGGKFTAPPEDLVTGLAAMKDIPTLVLGVASDILFPSWQQREIADTLRAAGNARIEHVELGEDRSLFGHDTFLLDVEGVGGPVKRFLSV